MCIFMILERFHHGYFRSKYKNKRVFYGDNFVNVLMQICSGDNLNNIVFQNPGFKFLCKVKPIFFALFRTPKRDMKKPSSW